ncbi:MAG: prepilin-type N-terminal cleavage/methylation domain-containing protein [Elusimicrobiaceae bacterium]|jgi:prepilin-type N-terminal cleavage/methylation domain-containing protein|nr:prepilin-type N-terminal cleavage/methylation domain-containing protein [Elusimicrobiaceae bacterium]
MKKGFSLIELLLVVVVLMTLVAWMLPQYLRSVQKENQTQKGALEQARELQKALNTRSQQQQFQLDNLDRALQNMPRKTGATHPAKKK